MMLTNTYQQATDKTENKNFFVAEMMMMMMTVLGDGRL